jgi:hypothetical protein
MPGLKMNKGMDKEEKGREATRKGKKKKRERLALLHQKQTFQLYWFDWCLFRVFLINYFIGVNNLIIGF